MAFANLQQKVKIITIEKSIINSNIMKLQDQRSALLDQQGEIYDLRTHEENEFKEFCKSIYEGNEDYQGAYRDYRDIPEFEDGWDKIAAKYQAELDNTSASETVIENQTTVESAKLEILQSEEEWTKSMLKNCIQEDCKFAGN